MKYPPGLVARSQAIIAKGVEAFRQNGILSFYLKTGKRLRSVPAGKSFPGKLKGDHLAGGAGQGLLVLPDLLLENFIHVRGHLNLLQTLNLPFQDGRVLLYDNVKNYFLSKRTNPFCVNRNLNSTCILLVLKASASKAEVFSATVC